MFYKLSMILSVSRILSFFIRRNRRTHASQSVSVFGGGEREAFKFKCFGFGVSKLRSLISGLNE